MRLTRLVPFIVVSLLAGTAAACMTFEEAYPAPSINPQRLATGAHPTSPVGAGESSASIIDDADPAEGPPISW